VLSSGISELVAKKAGKVQESFKFELSQVKEELKTINSPWIDIVKSDHRHKVLSRSVDSLARAIQIVQTSYFRALGLMLGFNSLDGD
jgi:predicted lipoprotein